MCDLSDTKLKGKGEGLTRWLAWCLGRGVGRAREWVTLLLSIWFQRCVVDRKEVSSRLMWVSVKIERES